MYLLQAMATMTLIRWSIFLVFLSGLCVESRITCRDNNNQPVDWYVDITKFYVDFSCLLQRFVEPPLITSCLLYIFLSPTFFFSFEWFLFLGLFRRCTYSL